MLRRTSSKGKGEVLGSRWSSGGGLTKDRVALCSVQNGEEDEEGGPERLGLCKQNLDCRQWMGFSYGLPHAALSNDVCVVVKRGSDDADSTF